VLGLLGLGSLGLWINGRRLRGSGSSFQRVATLAELEVGEPMKVSVHDIPPGTWALPPAQPVGEVWLIRRGPMAVEAYSARCPHQGGSLYFNGKQFDCALHGAAFDRACHRITGFRNPAPRDMDPLEVRQVTDPTSGQVAIEVRYQEFVTGVKERRVVDPIR
jgi:Rieske Fe-S protein